MIERAREITGKHINAIKEERRPGDPPILIGTAQKAMTILKWWPELKDLSIILETAWNWQKI